MARSLIHPTPRSCSTDSKENGTRTCSGAGYVVQYTPDIEPSYTYTYSHMYINIGLCYIHAQESCMHVAVRTLHSCAFVGKFTESDVDINSLM